TKLFLNSIYGKIGLRGYSEKVELFPYPRHRRGPSCSWSQIGFNSWLCFSEICREPRSNYPIAAYITDNARARLYRAFVETGALYGDTDSLVTTGAPPKNVGDGIGQWKFEGTESFQGNNVKDYRWGQNHVVKGGMSNL